MGTTDSGWIRLALGRPGPCVARVRWWASGVLLGDKRVYDATTTLRAPAGPVLVEVCDDREPADPARLAGSVVVVDVRAGWPVDATAGLRRGAVVTGTVERRPGRPARGAEVRAIDEEGRTVHTRTDGRGRFVLGGLAASAHDLRADTPSRASGVVRVVTSTDATAEASLLLDRPRTRDRAPLPLRVGGAFRGRVVEEADGAPAYAAVVEVRDARGVLLARARTDRDGGFVVGGGLRPAAGLTLVVKSGPDRIVVASTRRHGLAVGEARLVDLGTVRLAGAPRPRRHAGSRQPRATAAAMRLPATRV